MIQGGQSDLWDIVAEFAVVVANKGNVESPEVVQLYIHIPGGSPKQLHGYEKPAMPAGSSTTVRFALTRRVLSAWDAIAQNWKLHEGPYNVFVGSSSRDLPLRALSLLKVRNKQRALDAVRMELLASCLVLTMCL